MSRSVSEPSDVAPVYGRSRRSHRGSGDGCASPCCTSCWSAWCSSLSIARSTPTAVEQATSQSHRADGRRPPPTGSRVDRAVAAPSHARGDAPARGEQGPGGDPLPRGAGARPGPGATPSSSAAWRRRWSFSPRTCPALRDPEPAELKAWFETNSRAIRLAEPDHRSATCTSRRSAGRAGARRCREGAREAWETAGRRAEAGVSSADPFMFQDYYGDRAPEQVAKVFGAQFAEALFQARAGGLAGARRVRTRLASRLGGFRRRPAGCPPSRRWSQQVKSAWIAEQRAESQAQGVRGDAGPLSGRPARRSGARQRQSRAQSQGGGKVAAEQRASG